MTMTTGDKLVRLRHLKAVNDETKQIKNDLVSLGIDGKIYLNGRFVVGTLYADGAVNTTVKYRVCSSVAMSFDRAVALKIASGFRIWYMPTQTWFTNTVSIPANTNFKVNIARVEEDTSEELTNTEDFVKAVTIVNAFDQQQDTNTTINGRIDTVNAEINRVSQSVVDASEKYNVPISGTVLNGFYNTSTGAFAESQNFKTIKASVNSKDIAYYFTGTVYNVGFVSGVTYLDSNNNILSHSVYGDSSIKSYTGKKVDVNHSATYVAFTSYIGAGADVSASAERTGDIFETKKFVITGDSIETESAGLWSKMLTEKITFASYTNCAVGGTCMSIAGGANNAISSETRVNAMPAEADIVLVGGGTNDWGNDIALGSLDDLDNLNTFAGAVNSMISKMQTKYPNALIVFTSNQFTISPNRHNFSDATGIKNNHGLSASDYSDMMEKVCRYRAIPYIDVSHECGINALNYTSFLLNETNYYMDSVYMHPNESGAKKMLRVIYRWFENNKPVE